MAYPAKFTRTKNKGMTITELLVSSIMIGIVMVGVVSFALAIKNLQRSTNKTVFVALRTKAAMARLTQDALASVGDAQDRGVVAWTNGVNRASICFRHDDTVSPDNYDDDPWVCYWHDVSFELHRCEQPSTYSPGTGCNNNNKCCGGAVLRDEIAIQLSTSSGEFAVIEPNLEFITLTLTVRHIFNDPMHVIDNPEYTLTTQVSPLGHSR